MPLCLWDERLSTVGAFNLSSQLDIKVSKKIKNIDQNAAAFILQGFLDYLKKLILALLKVNSYRVSFNGN